MSALGAAGGSRESKSARTRKRILDAGARAFRRDGYAAAALKDIAALAGLQAGSLYYHFGSKEEIVEEVLEVGVEGVSAATREAVAALGPGSDPLARLRAARCRAKSASDTSSANVAMGHFGEGCSKTRLEDVGSVPTWSSRWFECSRSVLSTGPSSGTTRRVIRSPRISPTFSRP
jgi:AcrR family transcriptional regulator